MVSPWGKLDPQKLKSRFQQENIGILIDREGVLGREIILNPPVMTLYLYEKRYLLHDYIDEETKE